MAKFQLKTERRLLPNGVTRTLRFIDHPGAVLILPVLSPRRAVLLRQFRPALKSYLYEFPCGTLEPGERPLTCARRELAEEAGFRARNWQKLGVIHTAPGFTNEKIHLFQASGLSPQTAPRDPDEIIEVLPVSRACLKKMVADQKITDAKTVCALTFAGWMT